VSRSTRHCEPLSLGLIDLDDFQLVNNLHGHSHGDRILAALAQCLESHRLEDRRFRLGGDEFALSSPAVSLPDALIILERLRARAESLLFGATLSIGVATMDLDDSSNGRGNPARASRRSALRGEAARTQYRGLLRRDQSQLGNCVVGPHQRHTPAAGGAPHLDRVPAHLGHRTKEASRL
jgi:diguanylate cyclase